MAYLYALHYIAIALSGAAIAAGYRMTFVHDVNLVQEALLANAEYQLPKYLKGMAQNRSFPLILDLTWFSGTNVPSRGA